MKVVTMPTIQRQPKIRHRQAVAASSVRQLLICTELNATLERIDTMRKNLPLFFVTFMAAAAICVAQTKETSKPQSKTGAGNNFDQMIINRSKEVWEAYKNRNIPAMQALTGEDYASFSQTGPSNLQQDIATINKLAIESYSLDDPKVSKPAKDIAILRYKCDLKGSFDGKPFRPVYATEVWVNRGGKWQIVSYSETPVS
jgi:hypothetical protein